MASSEGAGGPKVHILYPIRDEPWGGGNQFLAALREYLRSRNRYAEHPGQADAILFNSHHELDAVLRAKRAFPGKAFLHRVDGPIAVVRGSGAEIDRTIFAFNQRIADGTIFQSEWSRARSREQGMPAGPLETVLHNAPDPGIFHPPAEPPRGDGRISIMAASWSTNPKKGFEVYAHLDAHLDFSRFSMTYMGNTPVPFKNIRQLPAAGSGEVAEALRQHSIFVSASHLEACSNAIVEALNCGLIALVRDNSSQPELVGDRRFVFSGPEDVVAAVERIGSDYAALHAARKVERMSDIGAGYLAFAEKACRLRAEGKGKRFGPWDAWTLMASGMAGRAKAKASRAWSRLASGGVR